MKIVKTIIDENGKEKEVIIHVCPICGKEMNETYLGRDYCDDCAALLEEKKEI